MIPVAFDLRDPLRSGIARVAVSLAREVARQSAGRFRITLAGPIDQLGELGAAGWSRDVTRVVDWDAGRYSLRAQRLWGRVRQEVGDAVWYFPHWDVPWLMAPRKFVVTVHDLAHLRLEFSLLKRAIANAWIRRSTARARRITTVSNYTRDELVREWPELAPKVSVVPNGVDDRFFEAAPALPESIEKKLPKDGPMMLSVGNLKSYKNLAMGPEVLARHSSLNWVVIGEWFPDWAGVEARARSLGVYDRMAVLGRQPDDVIRALYHRAAFLFFPSLHEGFGLPIVEALASGTPVVAGNAPGSVETLGSAGIVCDGRDAEALSRAGARVLAQGKTNPEALRARAREFSWSKAGERLSSLLEEVHAES